MPIREDNDSVRAYEFGRNKVWHDVARHRSEPTMHIGPKCKAKPYSPRYIAALPEVAQKCLGYAEQLALPAPGSAAIVRREINEMAVCAPQHHVLPGPLIDRIVSISRLSISDGVWTESNLRMPWAHQEMDVGNAALKDGECNEAATAFACIFGTMLPGFLMNKLTDEEASIFRAAWNSLQEFVDDGFIPALLAATNSHQHARTIEEMRWGNSVIPPQDFKRVGAPELLLAEDITRINNEIEKIKAMALPTGRDDIEVELLTFTPSKSLKLRIVGDVMVFPPPSVGELHKLNRYAAWVIDNTAKRPRLKLWKMRKWMSDIVMRRGSNMLRIKWSPSETPQSMGMDDFIIKWLAETEPSDEEALAAVGAERMNVEAYYNGRAHLREQLKDLTTHRDILLERLMALK